jgi:hypothetical protein
MDPGQEQGKLLERVGSQGCKTIIKPMALEFTLA